MKQQNLTFNVASFDVNKFDKILARGLCVGIGTQGQQVCIEAAICETLGLPHSDAPECVAPAVRQFKISLNDCLWSSPQARAEGLRDLGLAQLGSKGIVDDVEFIKRLAERMIRVLIPTLFRDIFKRRKLLEAADRCEREGTVDAAQAASKLASKYAASAKAAASVDACTYAKAAYTYAASASAKAAYAAYANAASGDACIYAAKASVASGDAYAAYASVANANATYATYASVANAASADAYAYRAAKAASVANAAYAAKAAKAAEIRVKDKYLRLSAKLALEVLRELNSPGVALLNKHNN